MCIAKMLMPNKAINVKNKYVFGFEFLIFDKLYAYYVLQNLHFYHLYRITVVQVYK